MWSKSFKVNSKIIQPPILNLGLLNSYKLIFAIELLMERRMSNSFNTAVHCI